MNFRNTEQRVDLAVFRKASDETASAHPLSHAAAPAGKRAQIGQFTVLSGSECVDHKAVCEAEVWKGIKQRSICSASEDPVAVQHPRCKTLGIIEVTLRPAERPHVDELVVMVLC